MQDKKNLRYKPSYILGDLTRVEIIALVSIVTLGAVIRAYFLNQPMRFDESATVLSYINSGWPALLNYTAPNNHLLNTVLIKLFTAVWGEHPAIIRIPTYVFGSASIVLTFMVCRALGNTGWFATFLVASHPYLILFSANARGYSALTFFTLLFLYQSIRYLQTKNQHLPKLLGLIGAIGLFNLPIMLFPVFGITLWITIQLLRAGELKPRLIREFYVPFILSGFVVCIFLYLPVLITTGYLNGGLKAAFQMIFNNEFVSANNTSFFIATIGSYINNLLRVYSQGVSILIVLLILILVVMALIGDAINHEYQATDLLIFMTLGAALLFLAKHTFPYPRTWIFMIPIVAIVADRGLGYLASLVKVPTKWLCLASGVATIVLAPGLTQDARMSGYQDTGVFEDAPAIAKAIHYQLEANDIVLAPVIPSNLPLYFYLWYEAKFNPKPAGKSTTGNTFLFLPNNHIRLEMYSHPPHPVDVGLHIKQYQHLEQVFTFNGSTLYKIND